MTTIEQHDNLMLVETDRSDYIVYGDVAGMAIALTNHGQSYLDAWTDFRRRVQTDNDAKAILFRKGILV